ncbi:LysR substrate-binding domain-containing protein [Vibrio sp. PP-XX7]
MLDKLVEKLGSNIHIHSEFSSIFGLSFALKSGQYVTLLPSRLTEVAEQIGLNFYPVEEALSTFHTIYLVMNRASEQNPAIRALIAECRMYSLKWNDLLK